jgi:hypothetical protein
MTAAFAQSSSASSNAPATASAPVTTGTMPAQAGALAEGVTAAIPPSKNGAAGSGMVRADSPDSAEAQLKNPTGAEPGTGSGMGKVSGTAAGN